VLSEKLQPTAPTTSYRRDGALKDAVETVERDMIQDAFKRCNGNKTHMAKQLGITRWTLLQRLKTYNIPSDKK
jgi:transcriptional regulator with PAS, ATPase and Fis domain